MKILKNKFFLILLAIIIFALAMIFLSSKNKKEGDKVCFKEACFKVEIVKTLEERNKGLMFKKNLAPDEGMLFVFDKEGYYSFWMKDMNFPIDIIWIGEDLKIVYIEKNVSPDSYPTTFISKENARYVLEVISGFSEKNNLKEGDLVRFLP